MKHCYISSHAVDRLVERSKGKYTTQEAFDLIKSKMNIKNIEVALMMFKDTRIQIDDEHIAIVKEDGDRYIVVTVRRMKWK